MLKGNITISVSGRTLLFFLLLLLIPELFPAGRAAAQTPSAAPAAAFSSSELKLVGTIRSSSFSGAVFSDSTGTQSFFRLNDKLPDGSRLVQISSKSIQLKNADGSQYELFISQDLKTAGQTAPPSDEHRTCEAGGDCSQTWAQYQPFERQEPQRGFSI